VNGPHLSPAATDRSLHWQTTLPGQPCALQELRRWAETLLPPCPTRDDVITVAVELGTNAVKYTASGHDGWFTTQITWHTATVRVAVQDGGAPQGPCHLDDPAGEHGRGLTIVHALAARYGVSGGPQGRLVWADLPWEHPATTPPASPPGGYEATIRQGQALLARLHPHTPAWYGRSTLCWWALPGCPGSLLSAHSAAELAGLLDRTSPSADH
jgi:anti-sigma regulatory factor (Ser/Thr protein kinase)